MKIRALLFASLTSAALAAGSTSAIAQIPTQDSVTANVPDAGFYTNITIDAHSAPSGQNPSGTAFFSVPSRLGSTTLGGTITCLSVHNNEAVLIARDSTFTLLKIEVTDGAATGSPDTFIAVPTDVADHPFDPTDCTPVIATGGSPRANVVSGDIAVIDAPALPTTKAQCKDGGWKNYGTRFRNQGQCIASVH